MEYQEFLKLKSFEDQMHGVDIANHEAQVGGELPLKDFQIAIIKWALAKGRSAIFADTGLGKTAMQVTWAYHVEASQRKKVLIFAPLAVAHQTVKEAKKWGVDIEYVRDDIDSDRGIYITNYEMIERFNIDDYVGVVLDESSILKSKTGKYRTELIDKCKNTPYRLSCTATPSPNDFMELGNQSAFLGVMSQSEMLSMFFTHDGSNTSSWRLKGHGKDKFWQWLSTWSCVIRMPSDLGFSDDGYKLPPINISEHIVQSKSDGQLFADHARTLNERRKAKRDTIEERCRVASEIVNNSSEQWIVWCHLNDEQKLLNDMIDRELVASVQGSDKDADKEDRLLGFASKKYNVIITKPSIAGFGLNWQQSNNMIFVGLDDSFEKYYQAVRRQYRFGQTKKVNVYIVQSESEGTIKANLEKKQIQHDQISENMISHMRDIMREKITGTIIDKTEYKPTLNIEIPSWLK